MQKHYGRGAARVGMRIFAALLIWASLAKAANPFPAASAIQRIGNLGVDAVYISYAVATIECFCALWMLMRPNVRLAQLLGLLSAVAILGARIVVARMGIEHCGCFGGRDINGAVVVPVVALGAGASAWSMFVGRDEGQSSVWLLCKNTAGVFVVAAIIVALMSGAARPQTPRTSLTRMIWKNVGVTTKWVIVGALECPECAEAVRRADNGQAGSVGEVRDVVMVVRNGDAGRQRELGRNVLILRIGDRLWWELVGLHPPSVFLWSNGALVPVAQNGIGAYM